MFEEFTTDPTADEWGLAAGVFIAQYRRRHGQGPTFRELFEHLLPDTDGVPSELPANWDPVERRRGSDFRLYAAVEWRRRGYLAFERGVTRSLRVGPRFRERSRALQQNRSYPHPTRSTPTDHPQPSTTPTRWRIDGPDPLRISAHPHTPDPE